MQKLGVLSSSKKIFEGTSLTQAALHFANWQPKSHMI